MGWADKAHKKHNKEKLTEELISQILNHPQYLEIKENIRREAVLDAFCAFCFVGCEYLETKHRYGQNGLLKFLEFAGWELSKMDKEQYFLDQVEYYKEKYNFDIMEVLNIELDDGNYEQVR